MRTLIAILLLTASASWAKPPFNYPSAVSYADETIATKVPKSHRIYLFGPEKITETYSLNGAPAKREVEMRRIYSHPEIKTISDLWKGMALDLKGKWILFIYRSEKPIEPVFTAEGHDVFRSDYPLVPGDVVLIVPASDSNSIRR